MNWFAYELSPLDYGWEHLKTVSETVCDLAKIDDSSWPPPDINSDDIKQFLSDWELAKAEATRIGWEGDFRHEPVVIWLPDETGFDYGFVFKQDNNGTTYVVSPVAMPWLKPI